ncbi:MAG TPA: VOC family protein, partial [Candidatus Saccharimonadales bacterium]|nr:VOC family protein [Candidatus Saccharimonadales bacterium]
MEDTAMINLKDSRAFSGFAVADLQQARTFYQDTLGITVDDNNGMGLILRLSGGTNVFLYEKPGHVPATFTVLNFPVNDIDATVDGLATAGVKLERYEGMDQDSKGIMRGKLANMGPDIAWFTD